MSKRNYTTHTPTAEELLLRSALGRRIRRLRRVGEIANQESFADAIGVSRVHMSKIELGRADLRFSTLLKIAQGLGQPLDELLRDLASEVPLPE
ncbi:helix-turn-helix domain-containing protein [Deinococcus radiopugnans]|nr:helix-turn-helix transcriptional regulator [Deinococcus radiopugnans]